jgi:aryl-alcohol dehydrogenase-like predicted oxidoreductase
LNYKENKGDLSMRTRHLGDLWLVSALTLGGGGIGQLWGDTTRDECISTARAAVDGGVTLLDMAPSYGQGEAERVIGAAFDGKLPDDVHITTKCRLGSPAPGAVEATLTKSLDESLARMRLERVDVFLLHSNIIPDNYDAIAYADRPATIWSLYEKQFRPACENLVAQGRIGAWGLTGIGIPDEIILALAESPKPGVVQCIANPLNSVGELKYYEGPTRAREIIATAKSRNVGVMGIRAVQGGAFTNGVDRALPEGHGVVADFNRASKFRTLAKELNQSAAALAHRYALTMDGVDTVVLGVKNRAELTDCLNAEAAGPLNADIMARVDASFT